MNKLSQIRFSVLGAMAMNNTVVWDVSSPDISEECTQSIFKVKDYTKQEINMKQPDALTTRRHISEVCILQFQLQFDNHLQYITCEI
jgi:hypothetical protein